MLQGRAAGVQVQQNSGAPGSSSLLPFLLEPIALEADAYQDDNLHPTEAAQPRILAHVQPALLPLLD